jgi:small redox-active disulfide protein 2
MEVKVLGSGCANCRNTVALIEKVAQRLGADVSIRKVEEIRDIMSYGVMATPAVVIGGNVVHAGGIPSAERVEQWLKSLGSPCCGSAKTGCCG